GPEYFQTRGFHPAYLEPADAIAALAAAWPEGYATQQVSQVHFYGSGCLKEFGSKKMRSILVGIFPEAEVIVKSDLEGAAVSTLGNSEGIAAVLGTGASAALWNGEALKKVSPSLGYLLGDEGSGADLGKILLRDFFYGKVPDEIGIAFNARYPSNPSVIIAQLHTTTQPSALLGEFAKLLLEYHEHPYVRQMVGQRFEAFIENQIGPLQPAKHGLIGLNGSVASGFSTLLTAMLQTTGFKEIRIKSDPLPSLVEWHTQG
ncbi:MAG: hypothetical protein IH599_09705, partial [Bacteroidales bacterium]|nr:hypothetical protein [Bacteroidales bacterium]